MGNDLDLLLIKLSALVLKQNHNDLAVRIQELSGKSRVEIIDGMEKIISEIKTKDLKSDNPTTQTIKQVYRQIVS